MLGELCRDKPQAKPQRLLSQITMLLRVPQPWRASKHWVLQSRLDAESKYQNGSRRQHHVSVWEVPGCAQGIAVFLLEWSCSTF
eukprot:4808635-Amphidinium_carterae.1